MSKEEFINNLGVTFMIVNVADSDDSIPYLQTISKELWDEVVEEYGQFAEMYDARHNGDERAWELMDRYWEERQSLPEEISKCVDWFVSY